MCEVDKYLAKLDALKDYLEYVNTDIDSLTAWEPDLYAAFATHNDLQVESIKDWYEEAEDLFISALGVDTYLGAKYDVWDDEGLEHYFEKEVYRDGTLYECGGYWFQTR